MIEHHDIYALDAAALHAYAAMSRTSATPSWDCRPAVTVGLSKI
jgi:hypothetical protein